MAPRAQPPPHPSGDRVVCSWEEVSSTSTNVATERGITSEKSGHQSLVSLRSAWNTAQEVLEELIRVQDVWMYRTKLIRQLAKRNREFFDKQTMLWKRRRTKSKRQGHQGRDRVEPEALGDTKGPSTFLGSVATLAQTIFFQGCLAHADSLVCFVVPVYTF